MLRRGRGSLHCGYWYPISEDPVAIDQACLDLVYGCNDPRKDHLIERIESRNGVHTVEAAAALGVGSREYELIIVE